MKRTTHYSGYPRGGTVAEPSPNDLGVVGTESGELYDTAQVGFSYGANEAYTPGNLQLEIETRGITPELTLDLAGSWQLRNTLHYGYSNNHSRNADVNLEKQTAYVVDGSLDPLNVAAADPNVINDILDWAAAADTEHQLFLVRSIADWEVLDLPAGPLRPAVGVEYAQEDAKNRKSSAPINGLSGYNSENRAVKSVFGESFNAPTALDALGTADDRYVTGRAASVPNANNEPVDPNSDVFLLEGSDPGLARQTADVWTAGFDLLPLEGLTINFNYYSIDFKDLLGSPDRQDPQAVLLNPDKFIFNPTQAQYQEAVDAVANSSQFANTSYENVGVIVDRRISQY